MRAKAHQGREGNEKADKKAKMAAMLGKMMLDSHTGGHQTSLPPLLKDALTELGQGCPEGIHVPAH